MSEIFCDMTIWEFINLLISFGIILYMFLYIVSRAIFSGYFKSKRIYEDLVWGEKETKSILNNIISGIKKNI